MVQKKYLSRKFGGCCTLRKFSKQFSLVLIIAALYLLVVYGNRDGFLNSSVKIADTNFSAEM